MRRGEVRALGLAPGRPAPAALPSAHAYAACYWVSLSTSRLPATACRAPAGWPKCSLLPLLAPASFPLPQNGLAAAISSHVLKGVRHSLFWTRVAVVLVNVPLCVLGTKGYTVLQVCGRGWWGLQSGVCPGLGGA